MPDNLLTFIPIGITIFHLTDINTVILSTDGTVLLVHERNHLPSFLVGIQKENFLYLSSEAEKYPNQTCMYTNEWGLSYLSNLIQIDGYKAKILVAGPFLMQYPDTSKLRIDQNKRIVLEGFLQGLKLMGRSKMHSIANLLDKAGSLQQATLQILETHQSSLESYQKTSIDLILQQPDEEYVIQIELRYEIEKKMMRAVELGDKLLLKEIISKAKNIYDLSERFPNKPVRAMRNMLIIFNTVFRIAAHNGKVQPFLLHQISERFSKQIERSESVETLNNLIYIMCNEYCDLVNNRSTSGYSQLVTKSMEYIMLYFSKPLNLNKLSQQCLVHPAHLSRQFKKETGMTLSDFQLKLRITEAKLLLRKDQDSISSIAGYVGFNDAGYFTRAFKKIEGVTPSDYRNFDLDS